MKLLKIKHSPALAIFLLTTACSSLSVGPVVKQVKESPPPANDYKELMNMDLATQDYSKWLQKDYKALTLFEYDEMYDYDSAEHFAVKSLSAGRGQILKPDAVSSRDIPPMYREEAGSMYSAIQDAYAKGNNYHYPKDMARLQVSYDCWLEQVEEDIQPNHIMKCKDLFYAALANMKDVAPPAPQPVPATIVLYFGTGSYSIPLSEAQKLEAAVKDDTIAHAGIIIEGYADTVDTSEYNETLSQQRAEAVKNAIQAFDSNITNVSIQAWGETNLAVPTPDKVEEQQNRRAVVYFK